MGALYALVASVLVWAPVAFYVAAGRRTRVWLTQAEVWLLANQRLFAAVSLLIFGAVLAVDGVVRFV